MNLYETLGIKKDATQQEIKSALYKKAKKNHPDKTDGSKKATKDANKKMADINKAYMILSDLVKRKHYDETGEEEETPFEKKFSAFIEATFMNMIDSVGNYESVDLIAMLRSHTNTAIVNLESQKVETNSQIEKYTNIKNRIKSDKNTAIQDCLKNKIYNLKKIIKTTQEDIAFILQCETIIEEYSYEFDTSLQPTQEQQLMQNRIQMF